MLNEQITEFKLRGSGPPGRFCIPTTGYFYDKTKIFESNLRVDYNLQLKYCTRPIKSFIILAVIRRSV